MPQNAVTAGVRQVYEHVEALGPALAFRKLHGILNALEMQVEDGRYQRHAVVRLCEALLAAAEDYAIPEEARQRLETLVCKVVSLVQP